MKRILIALALILGAVAALTGVATAQESGGVAASGSANAKITITLGDTSLALGTPDPACEGNPDSTVVGEFTLYNGATGNEGCGYVWSSLSVRVKSNKAWTGDIDGADGTPTSGITVVNGSFRYDTAAAQTSYSNCSADTTLTTTTAQWEASGTLGNTLYTFYHCVILDWDDADGSIDSTITYTVSQ